ncbi:unnamed protein product, partial [Iphiclides podalirius]
MDEIRFRVSVCLQRYYSDERSRAYISVIPRYQVQWLEQRLRTLFDLRGRFCLRSRGHLLPSEEPLSLLQPDDPVEVIPLSGDVIEEEEKILTLNGMEHSHFQKSFKSNNLPHKVNRIGVPAIMSQKDERDDSLIQVKQQALELLERFSGDSSIVEPDGVSAKATSDPPRRTRRRVRRRKRRPSTEGNSGEDTTATTERQSIEMETMGDAGKNDSIGLRKPRLVHSLSPSQS